MSADRLRVHVVLADDGASDADALSETAGRLGEELSGLDVDAVEPVSVGEAPPGAKGVELVALGVLVVRLARSRKVLGQVVDAIRDWATRNAGQHVRMEIDGDVIDVTGVSDADRAALIDAWLQRHGGR